MIQTQACEDQFFDAEKAKLKEMEETNRLKKQLSVQSEQAKEISQGFLVKRLSFDGNRAGQPSHLEALLNAGESQVHEE